MQWQKFQFPTGWNSTLFKPSFSLSSLVSIPNGMEFYPRGRFIVWTKASFNSQWDGIILKQATINAGFAICFNSQRDRLPAQFILINKVLDLLYQIYSTKARNLPYRINSARFYFTLFISISPSRAPISIRSPVLISSLRIISAILSSSRS